MTSKQTRRRRRGRAIRKARRYDPGVGHVFVNLTVDTDQFTTSVARVMRNLATATGMSAVDMGRIWDAFIAASTAPRRQILHNGRKPR